MFEINVWTVLIAAMITAIATGVGAVPFVFVKDVGRWSLGIANAAAGGFMLAASHSLVHEGTNKDFGGTLIGILVGLGLIVVANKLVKRQGDLDVAELSGANAHKAILILGVMTAHSFAEGIGVGVSFGGSDQLGAFITSAIALHNIPEGLAISLVLVPRGTPVWKAALWSIFTSLPQPIMAVPAFLFVLTFEPFLPVGLGLAAGAMIWMVFAELVPDAIKETSDASVGFVATFAFAAMLALQNYVL